MKKRKGEIDLSKIILKMMACLSVVFLLFPTVGTAATTQWEAPTKEVQPNKTWNVTLSNAINSNSLGSVYVIGEDGKKVINEVSIAPNNDRVVVVKAPKQGYALGKTYTLYIDQSVASKSGAATLKNSTKMPFTIVDKASDSFEQLVLGTWKTTYQDYPIVVTLNSDFTLSGLILDMQATGTYSLNNSKMTVHLLGYTVSGEITKISDREFIITSASGNVMRFTK